MLDYFPLKVELTASQAAALALSPDVIISGSAGTGKTLLTILLAEKIKANNPNSTVQIVILTRSLKRFIEKSIVQRKLNKVTVSTYFSWSGYPSGSDYIIVDEVQDLKVNDIKAIRTYSKYGIYLLGDSNQMIYNDNLKGSTVEEIALELNFKVLKLKEVVRFNKGIKDFISSGFPYLDDITSIRNEIVKPKIIRFNTDEEQYDELAKIITTLPEVGTTGIFVFQNNDVKRMLHELLKRKVQVTGYKINSEEKLVFQAGAVNILTYHSAKGLEFDNVVLPDFDHGHGFRNEIYYVGFSRAKERLYLLHKNDFPAWFILNDKDSYDGEVSRLDLIKQAEFDFDIQYGVNIMAYKHILTPEKIKEKFESILLSAIQNARETLKLTELSEVEIESLIKEWENKYK